MEIRIHGRGGQGGVTCAKILATLYAGQGKSVQSFGDYAGERSGAPVRAYVRVADAPITNRNKVYRPDHLLVLDPSLLDAQALEGLAHGGWIVVASREPGAELAARFPGHPVATIDAVAIARRHGIGTRSVAIVNTTMAGALARALGIPWEPLEATFRKLGFDSDLGAAREAYEGAALAPAAAATQAAAPQAPASPPPEVLDLIAHVEGPAPALRTGSWRSQLPRYVERLAPCGAACPAGNDVAGFLQALARHGEEAAAEVLSRTTPLAAICGRVCPGFCMQQCNRLGYDEAVDVRSLERWIADRAVVARLGEVAPGANGSLRVAVVGGGPAGLSAAYSLLRGGHQPTIFEAGSALGGVLRTGIPGYRLPRQVLERELEALLDLGLEARCDTRVTPGHLAALAGAFDGVILATGLQSVRGLEVPGAELPGIEQGITFLGRLNAGLGRRLPRRVVVLGGGNTAVDCARAALRCGASRVFIVYRRSREEMPAIPEEIEQAVEEGVGLVLLRAPVAFHGGEWVESVELAEVALGAPDASGRRRPVLGEGRQSIRCDRVLLALGQTVETTLLPAGWVLREGQVWEGEAALPIFAAGDLSSGEGTVPHAIGDGRRAAQRLLACLGQEVEPWSRPDPATALPVEAVRLSHFHRQGRSAVRHRDAGRRSRDFREVVLGLPDAREALRCFSCGDCNQCDTCLASCPDGIIRRDGAGYAVDLDYCKGCGVCVAECPRGAMEMVIS
jgi:2-oxoacid:acceptor oxidoreductase gamma subunit (pyruvate/2-ketoisovalerate family)